jgi:class 3 adenylate cyclase
MRCPACSRENAARSRFCNECGQPLPSSVEHPPRHYTPRHLAERILAEQSIGERKTITALFADIKGSMDLASQVPGRVA